MSIVSSRYARALFEALTSDGSGPEAGLSQLESFAAVLVREPAAREILLNPVVLPEHRDRFIARIAEALGMDIRVRKLIGLLVERRRVGILDDVIAAYRGMLDEKNGIVRAVVTAAELLDESERLGIARRLEQSLGKQVVMDVRQDATLLGGVVVRIGGTVYDGSLRQYLGGLRSRLAAS